MRPRRATLFLACCIALSSCEEPSDVTAPGTSSEPQLQTSGLGSWTYVAKMPTARFGLAAAAVNNASGHPIVYAVGGVSHYWAPLRRVEAYDYVTNTWTRKADLPYIGAGAGGVGAVTIGAKVYVPGGPPDGRRLYVYDPSTNTWTTRAIMPIGSLAGGMSAGINGKLYVLIGRDPDAPDSALGRRLYRFNPSTNTWTRRADCPEYHFLGAVGTLNGKLYVTTGRDSWWTYYDDVANSTTHVYDPATNVWSTAANGPSGTIKATGAALNNQWYVLGGEGWPAVDGTEPSSGLNAYDPATDAWSLKARMLTARSRPAAVGVTYRGLSSLLVMGGRSWTLNTDYEPVDEVTLRTVEKYTP